MPWNRYPLPAKVTEKRCAKCQRVLPAEMFHRHRGRKLSGLNSHCRECLGIKNLAYTPQAWKPGDEIKCLTCGVVKPQELFRVATTNPSKTKRRQPCRECFNKTTSKNHKRLRLKIIQEYGSQCSCCGETIIEFLTIDHVFNDGAAIRKAGGRAFGSHLYRKLRQEGFPKDRYQLLCWNCNCAKRYDGQCPHKRSS